VNILYTSRDQIDVYRFSLPVTILAPLLAIAFQTFISGRITWLAVFDLPLLVTIFFAVSRRNAVTGLLQGGVIGIVQDAFTHHPLGVFGIAKTIIGFIASSLGGKLDVDNPGSRLLMTSAFYIIHQLIFFGISRGMLQQAIDLRWSHLLLVAVLNGLLAVVIFSVMDRFKRT